eukprot:3582587-Pyramimonas_sp.AAC.1
MSKTLKFVGEPRSLLKTRARVSAKASWSHLAPDVPNNAVCWLAVYARTHREAHDAPNIGARAILRAAARALCKANPNLVDICVGQAQCIKNLYALRLRFPGFVKLRQRTAMLFFSTSDFHQWARWVCLTASYQALRPAARRSMRG